MSRPADGVAEARSEELDPALDAIGEALDVTRVGQAPQVTTGVALPCRVCGPMVPARARTTEPPRCG